MDAEGSVLVTQGARSVAGFEANLGKLQRLFDARAKAKAGDAAAEIDVALSEGELDMIPFEEVQKRLENKKLTEAQTAMLGEVELGAMVSALHKAEDEATGKAALKTIAVDQRSTVSSSGSPGTARHSRSSPQRARARWMPSQTSSERPSG